LGQPKVSFAPPLFGEAFSRGFLSAVLASVLLAYMLYKLQEDYADLVTLENLPIYLMVFGGLVTLGMIITGISTFFAVNKYLKINMDKLYMI
jgi:cell division transport system permease protein